MREPTGNYRVVQDGNDEWQVQIEVYVHRRALFDSQDICWWEMHRVYRTKEEAPSAALNLKEENQRAVNAQVVKQVIKV